MLDGAVDDDYDGDGAAVRWDVTSLIKVSFRHLPELFVCHRKADDHILLFLNSNLNLNLNLNLDLDLNPEIYHASPPFTTTTNSMPSHSLYIESSVDPDYHNGHTIIRTITPKS